MAVVVEHDKRKHEILAKSLDLFTEDGYDDVTFQKIADRCGITRTTLYIYFKNKREIFTYSIKQFTDSLEKNLLEISQDNSISAGKCLGKIIKTIIKDIEDNRQLIKIIIEYLLAIQKTGTNVREKISRRLIRVRHLINTVIIRGIENKEIKSGKIKDINRLFTSLFESAVLHITVYGDENLDDLITAVDECVDCISLTKNRSSQ
jgi:AcrR family transcriptional regulator